MGQYKQIRIFYLIGLFFSCMSLFDAHVFAGPMPWPKDLTTELSKFLLSLSFFHEEIKDNLEQRVPYGVITIDKLKISNPHEIDNYGIVTTQLNENLAEFEEGSPVKINKNSIIVHQELGQIKLHSSIGDELYSIKSVIKLNDLHCTIFLLEDNQYNKHLFCHDVKSKQLERIDCPADLKIFKITKQGGFILARKKDSYDYCAATLLAQEGLEGLKVQIQPLEIPDFKEISNDFDLVGIIEIAPRVLQIRFESKVGSDLEDEMLNEDLTQWFDRFYALQKGGKSNVILKEIQMGKMNLLDSIKDSTLIRGFNENRNDYIYYLIQDRLSDQALPDVKLVQVGENVIGEFKKIRSDLFIIQFKELGYTLCTLVESESEVQFEPLKIPGLEKEETVAKMEDLGSDVVMIEFSSLRCALYHLIKSQSRVRLDPLEIPGLKEEETVVVVKRLGIFYEVSTIRSLYSTEHCFYYILSQKSDEKKGLEKVIFPKLNDDPLYIILGKFDLLYCLVAERCLFYQIITEDSGAFSELKKLGETVVTWAVNIKEKGNSGIICVDQKRYQYSFLKHCLVEDSTNFNLIARAMGNLFKRCMNEKEEEIILMEQSLTSEEKQKKIEFIICGLLRESSITIL